MSRMFIKVMKNTLSPILGGFIILKDHQPQGNYKEVVFRQNASILMTVVGVQAGATTVTVAFKNGTSIIRSISGYAVGATLATLATNLNTDVPGLGSFAVSALYPNTITISNPISRSLVGTITYA
jgi:hypothetical protein